MIKGEYDYLDNLAKLNLCAEHNTPLTVARHAEEACFVIRCGEGHYPDTLVHNPSATEEYKQGKLENSVIVDKILKGQRRRAMQQGKQSTAITFQGVPATDLGTGELLPLETVKALVAYAEKYHLDPARGHVVLMYSKPYITIDGYLYHANRSGIVYSLQSRPMNTWEGKEYKIEPADHGWISELVLTKTGQKFTGVGIVTYAEMTEESKGKPGQLRSPVVAKHPWQLAQKRAEWQALRRAFPIGITEEEHIDTGDKAESS